MTSLKGGGAPPNPIGPPTPPPPRANGAALVDGPARGGGRANDNDNDDTAAAVAAARPGWNRPGILAALRELTDAGMTGDQRRAAGLAAAADPGARTPRVMTLEPYRSAGLSPPSALGPWCGECLPGRWLPDDNGERSTVRCHCHTPAAGMNGSHRTDAAADGRRRRP